MTQQELERVCPKLDALSLAIAIDTCRKAGAENAAIALSHHITRLEIDAGAMTDTAILVAAEAYHKRRHTALQEERKRMNHFWFGEDVIKAFITGAKWRESQSK